MTVPRRSQLRVDEMIFIERHDGLCNGEAQAAIKRKLDAAQRGDDRDSAPARSLDDHGHRRLLKQLQLRVNAVPIER